MWLICNFSKNRDDVEMFIVIVSGCSRFIGSVGWYICFVDLVILEKHLRVSAAIQNNDVLPNIPNKHAGPAPLFFF